MKYIKLFMLIVAATLFTACSDDDNYNTDASTVVEFENSTMTVKENEGMVNIPVKITGKRNGMIRLTVTTEGSAKEYVVGQGGDYMMTTKTLVVNADTLTSEVVNFEMKVIDDELINDDRNVRFNLTVEGAKVGANQSLDVLIENNERSVYDLFGGDWVMSYSEAQTDDEGNPMEDENGNPVYTDRTADVTLTVISDETNPDYGKTIFAYAPTFYLTPLGGEGALSWSFNYAYDEAKKTGTLSFNCSSSETIFTYSVYSWYWQVPTAKGGADGEVPGTFTVSDNNEISNEIKFSDNAALYFYGGGNGQIGAWAAYEKLGLKRK